MKVSVATFALASESTNVSALTMAVIALPSLAAHASVNDVVDTVVMLLPSQLVFTMSPITNADPRVVSGATLKVKVKVTVVASL
jgi:hypothetical protein